MSDIYSTLNPQQQEAFYHTEGPMMGDEDLPTALLT